MFLGGTPQPKNRDSIPSKGTGTFLNTFPAGSEAHPEIHSMSSRNPFPGAKRPSCDTEHSPPSNVKVKNQWSYASAPPYAFTKCVHPSLLQLSTLLLMQLTPSI